MSSSQTKPHVSIGTMVPINRSKTTLIKEISKYLIENGYGETYEDSRQDESGIAINPLRVPQTDQTPKTKTIRAKKNKIEE